MWDARVKEGIYVSRSTVCLTPRSSQSIASVVSVPRTSSCVLVALDLEGVASDLAGALPAQYFSEAGCLSSQCLFPRGLALERCGTLCTWFWLSNRRLELLAWGSGDGVLPACSPFYCVTSGESLPL